MAFYYTNTENMQLSYSIVYSVQYMQLNTATYFSNSKILGAWTVLFNCMTPCWPVYF